MQTSTMQRICAVLIMSISLALLPYVAQAAQPETEVDCTGASEPIALHYGDHTIHCEINPATDVDTFQFIGAADDRIRIVVLATNGLNGRLVVRDPIGTVMKDTFCNGFFGTCSLQVNLSLTLPGTYSLAVSDQGSSTSGGYVLEVERMYPPLFAPPLAYDSTVSDTISPATDLDFLTFGGGAGTQIRIVVLATQGLNGRLEVRDPTGAVIKDTFCNGFFGTCSLQVDLSLTLSGTYSLAVSDQGSSTSGGYQVSLTCLFGACPAVPPAFILCDIQMSKTSYATGDTVTAQVLRLANPKTVPVPIELAIWFEVPGLPSISFVNTGADGSVKLTAGFNQNFGPMSLFTVTSAFPRGTYGFHCRIVDPVTKQLLAEDRNPFTIQ